MKVIGEIYETKDYDKFTFMDENRVIDERNFADVKQSIHEEGQLVPIVVNENFEVLDGQHRSLACEQLGRPLKFIKLEGRGMKAVYTMNNIQKKWTLEDSLKSGVARGDESYIKVDRVYRETGLLISVIIMALCNKNITSNSGNMGILADFKEQNNFKIDLDNFDKLREKLIKFNEVFSYFKKHQRSMAGAFFNYMVDHPRYEHIRMLERLRKIDKMTYEKLLMEETIKAKVRLLTKIYNHNKHDKVAFYVEEIY